MHFARKSLYTIINIIIMSMTDDDYDDDVDVATHVLCCQNRGNFKESGFILHLKYNGNICAKSSIFLGIRFWTKYF